MHFVFLGTTEFSTTLLRCLLHHTYRPLLVVCNPDRPFGRKKILAPPPAKQVAIEAGIPVLQPEQLGQDAERELVSTHADFFILADYGKIIPPTVVRVPRLGIIGVHVSLLPKYRGPSPMQSAILEGEKETGVTLYLLDEKIDHGPVLTQAKLELHNQTFLELRLEAAGLACALLKETLPKLIAGSAVPKTQDESLATYTKKFTSEDAFVSSEDLERASRGEDWELANRISRKIRALNPEPGVWTIREGKRIKLLAATVEGNRLKLKTIQCEGEKPRPTENSLFLRS